MPRRATGSEEDDGGQQDAAGRHAARVSVRLSTTRPFAHHLVASLDIPSYDDDGSTILVLLYLSLTTSRCKQ